MPEQREEATPWHVLWVKILTQAHQQGRSVESAIAEADTAVVAYSKRLDLDAEGERHDGGSTDPS